MSSQSNRRQFLRKASAAFAVVTGSNIGLPRRAGRTNILGTGEFEYRYDHDWAQLPEKFTWQTTHNVAVDAQGFVYVIHEGHADKSDHPSIFVFDNDGKFVRAFGEQFQGGGHGLEVRREGSEEYLYVAAYQQVKAIAKLTLRGEVVWQRYAPMQSGVYAKGEDTDRQKTWGRDRFMPTNFAFLADGDFLLADGYGSYYIHRYDKEGNWKSHFGGPGDGKGKFNTPHGLWIDDRREPATLIVADRAHHNLQRLDLDGKHLETISGFGLPANIDRRGDLLLVPELYGRVSILDSNNRVTAQLGDDNQRIRGDEKFEIRRDSKLWRDGKFIHPHDACFDLEGNILVAEWVASGRLSRLTRLN